MNGKELKNGDMLYFSSEGDEITIEERTPLPPLSGQVKVLVMAGKPLEQPVVNYGPFVMTSEAEIEEAFHDFREGKMG